jgi:hypothetical protein
VNCLPPVVLCKNVHAACKKPVLYVGGARLIIVFLSFTKHIFRSVHLSTEQLEDECRAQGSTITSVVQDSKVDRLIVDVCEAIADCC